MVLRFFLVICSRFIFFLFLVCIMEDNFFARNLLKILKSEGVESH